MDEEVYKKLKDTILKTINNGIAFKHMESYERETKEQQLIDFLNKTGYESYLEDCMVWVLDKKWKKIVMMEMTRNTLYFTPYDSEKTPEIVFYVLQFVAKEYLGGLISKDKKTNKDLEKDKQEEIEEDSDEDTEEDKPPPDFSFL